MNRCKKCNSPTTIPPEMRERIRWFCKKYFYIKQADLAKMLGISQPRMSEIVRSDERKGGA